MKKLFAILTMLLFMVCSCGPTAKEAAEYNNAIVTQQKIVLEKVSELDNAIGNFDNNKMDKALKDLEESLGKALAEIKSLEDVDGCEGFKKASISYFETFNNLISEHYPALMTIFRLPPENYTSTEEQMADSIQNIINEKHKQSQDEFIKAQSEFAKKHNIELE
ncbi:MAG: hypothetical protein JXR58_04265 [Bacteroidales bacterium]|nr:hypothetical protein [Bacteroidales bacterium]